MKTVYAEDMNYWKSSQSSPDLWLDKAKAEIRVAGGRVKGEFFGAEPETGRALFSLEFEIGDDRYRSIWPVLPCRAATPTNRRAARIQAATMLYHDIKSRCVAAKVLGARAAFLAYLVLPDGRTAAEASTLDLVAAWPKLLPSPKGQTP